MVSFDSSGWLYVYHMGVGWWLQRNLNTDDRAKIAFSGASAGALMVVVRLYLPNGRP